MMTGLEDMDAREQYAIRVQWRMGHGKWIDSLVRSEDGRHVFVSEDKQEIRTRLIKLRSIYSTAVYTPVILCCYKLTEPL